MIESILVLAAVFAASLLFLLANLLFAVQDSRTLLRRIEGLLEEANGADPNVRERRSRA
jgi:hypothetical protein